MSPPPLSIQVSNTIAACNYMARTSARPAPARTRRTWLARSSKLPRGGASAPVPPAPAPPPAIVISEDVSTNVAVAPDDEAPATKRRESLGTIALKVTRDKSLGRERRRSQGDMSHIRAKWLLGFNLTMVMLISYIMLIELFSLYLFHFIVSQVHHHCLIFIALNIYFISHNI